jgi:hypothetical protein
MARKKIIPKRIGAVKVPKKLRKLGDEVLADPRAREIAGSALLALGTALVARGTRKGSVLRDIFNRPGESARAARDPGSGAADRAGEAVSGVADAVGHVVGEVFDTLRRDFVRKIRPVRPRHAHDDNEAEEPQPETDGPKAEGSDDRMH